MELLDPKAQPHLKIGAKHMGSSFKGLTGVVVVVVAWYFGRCNWTCADTAAVENPGRLGGSMPKVAPSLGKHQVGKILGRDDNMS